MLACVKLRIRRLHRFAESARFRKLFHIDHSMPGLQTELHGIGESRPVARQHDTVDHNIDIVAFLLVQFRKFIDRIHRAVYPDASETLPVDFGESLLVAALFPLHDRRIQDYPDFARTVGKLENRVDNLLRRLAHHFTPALRTMRHSDASVEKTQIVVNLGDGGYDGTRIAAGRALFDGDCRGQTLDLLDIGLLHLVEKLPRIRAQRLHIAALPFRVQRIEGKRTLAASR